MFQRLLTQLIRSDLLSWPGGHGQTPPYLLARLQLPLSASAPPLPSAPHAHGVGARTHRSVPARAGASQPLTDNAYFRGLQLLHKNVHRGETRLVTVQLRSKFAFANWKNKFDSVLNILHTKKHLIKCIFSPDPRTKIMLQGVQGNSAISSNPKTLHWEATKPLIIPGNDMFGKKCHTCAPCIFSKHLMRGCETVAAVHGVLVQGLPSPLPPPPAPAGLCCPAHKSRVLRTIGLCSWRPVPAHAMLLL